MATYVLGPMHSFSPPQVEKRGFFSTTKTLVQFQRSQIGVKVNFGPGGKLLGIKMYAPITIGVT